MAVVHHSDCCGFTRESPLKCHWRSVQHSVGFSDYRQWVYPVIPYIQWDISHLCLTLIGVWWDIQWFIPNTIIGDWWGLYPISNGWQESNRGIPMSSLAWPLRQDFVCPSSSSDESRGLLGTERAGPAGSLSDWGNIQCPRAQGHENASAMFRYSYDLLFYINSVYGGFLK